MGRVGGAVQRAHLIPQASSKAGDAMVPRSRWYWHWRQFPSGLRRSTAVPRIVLSLPWTVVVCHETIGSAVGCTLLLCFAFLCVGLMVSPRCERVASPSFSGPSENFENSVSTHVHGQLPRHSREKVDFFYFFILSGIFLEIDTQKPSHTA